LYGISLAVIAMASRLRPWKACSNTTTSLRPVATRAIFTAFSTASAPVENSAVRLGWVPGVSRLRRSATSTYPSYPVTRKQVWVNLAACSCTRETTSGALAPTLVTAIPEARSMRWLPSTSTMMAPPARSTKTGRFVPSPRGTACERRCWMARESGPGSSVTRVRRCSGCSVSEDGTGPEDVTGLLVATGLMDADSTVVMTSFRS
jgi:hypothetical protein